VSQLASTGELKRRLSPSLDLSAELLMPGVVDLEFVPPEPTETAEHLGERRRREAAVLLRSQPAEPVEPVARFDCHQVDEVPRLRSAEERKHLVDRELVAAEHRGGARGVHKLAREARRCRRTYDVRNSGAHEGDYSSGSCRVVEGTNLGRLFSLSANRSASVIDGQGSHAGLPHARQLRALARLLRVQADPA
jgi:hypothetical protein